MTHKVLITQHPDNHYTARALALPDIVASGGTEQEALEKLRAAITETQVRSRVVEVDLPLPVEATHDPWLRFAGIWKNDPSWDEFQAEVEAYRKEIDARFPPE